MKKNHISSIKQTYRNEMMEVLTPHLEALGSLKTEHIAYRQFLKSGETLYFCSTDQYQESFIEQDEMKMHYAKEILLLNREGYNFVIRSSANTSNAFLQKLLILDLCNSLVVYKKEEDIIHMYCFIFSSSNTSAINHFINRREVFEKVVLDCQETLSVICAKPEYKTLREKIFSQKFADGVFLDTNNHSLKLDNNMYTKRQKECVSLLLKGATNKDIAQRLNICPKTVEYHISNLKSKLDCSNRFGITEKIIF